MTEEVKLSELLSLCEELFTQRDHVAQLKKEKTAQEKLLSDLEFRVIELLDHHKLKTFDTGFGKVTKKSKPYAKITDKDALASYLKAQGIYDDLVTLNAAKLNSFYNEEFERAKAEMNLDFKIDGMEVSSSRTTLSIIGAKPKKGE